MHLLHANALRYLLPCSSIGQYFHLSRCSQRTEREEGYFFLSFIALFQCTQVWGMISPAEPPCSHVECASPLKSSVFFAKWCSNVPIPTNQSKNVWSKGVSHTRRGSDLRRCQNWARGETQFPTIAITGHLGFHPDDTFLIVPRHQTLDPCPKICKCFTSTISCISFNVTKS